MLGALSDRFGRRPVLLISLAGAAVDYLALSFAPELWMLVVGRAIAGITSANMAIATAYITDITLEEKRAQRSACSRRCSASGLSSGQCSGAC